MSALPGLTLLLRGLVWGSDSFGFWSVSCGASEYAKWLNSPDWFVWFLQNVISCNLYLLALSMFILYFFSLLGLFMLGKFLFSKENAWKLPVYVACLTPLFFIEAMRLENDFFGWTLALIVVGLVFLAWEKTNPNWFRGLAIVLGGIIACFSVNLWLPSIILMVIPLLFLPFSKRIKDISTLFFFCIIFFTQWGFLFIFWQHNSIISEYIPFLGLVYILHILHFWKRIPQPLTFFGIGLLVLGILKAKFIFLFIPFLIAGMIDKELKEGLSIPKLGVDKVPVSMFLVIFVVGWVFMGLSSYPTQSDVNELKEAVALSEDLNVPLYNSWGDGWLLVSLGFDTNYYMSPPEPDWNSLKRPYIAWCLEDIVGCERISKRTQQCN